MRNFLVSVKKHGFEIMTVIVVCGAFLMQCSKNKKFENKETELENKINTVQPELEDLGNGCREIGAQNNSIGAKVDSVFSEVKALRDCCGCNRKPKGKSKSGAKNQRKNNEIKSKDAAKTVTQTKDTCYIRDTCYIVVDNSDQKPDLENEKVYRGSAKVPTGKRVKCAEWFKDQLLTR